VISTVAGGKTTTTLRTTGPKKREGRKTRIGLIFIDPPGRNQEEVAKRKDRV